MSGFNKTLSEGMARKRVEGDFNIRLNNMKLNVAMKVPS